MENWQVDPNSGGRDRSALELKAQIAALLRERRGYEAQGKADRVADVDAALALLGHEAAKPSSRAERRPASGKRERR